DILIVEVQLRPALLDDQDLLLIGEFLESARVSNSFEHGGWNQKGIRSGPVDFSLDKILPAIDLLHCHGDFGSIDLLDLRVYAVVNNLREGFWGETRSLDVAQEW